MTKPNHTTRPGLSASVALGLAGALLASLAHAQSAGTNDTEIALLKQQLRLMEQKLDRLQKQTEANAASAAKANAKVDAKVDAKTEPPIAVANANAAYPVKGPVAPSDVVVTMPNNRPTICTADNLNCVAVTGRVHFDAGGYDYHPNTAATAPQRLDDGVNVRRARIGVIGKFLGDWNYALIYDFGGASDGFGGTGSAGGTPVGFLPGGAVSGIENAYLSYTGFKPLGGRLAIEGGVMDLPYTLDEATSSNDVLFMERAASNVTATSIAAGDFRSAFGARWYTDRFWAGAYVTGAGDRGHSLRLERQPQRYHRTIRHGRPCRGSGRQRQGLLAASRRRRRVAHPAAAHLIAGTQTLTLSDRPEVRIDPTTLISTGAIAGVSGAQVYSVEAAGTYGPLFFQGEYYWYNIDRNAFAPLPSLNFQGGYAEASYVLTGETHPYNPGSASYSPIAPADPFLLTGGGWAPGRSRAGTARSISTTGSARRPASPAAGRRSIRWR